MSHAACSTAGCDRRPAAAAAATGRSGAACPRRPRLRKKLELVLLLGPALVLFVGFVLAPIGIAVQYSLYNWSGFGRADRLHRRCTTTRQALDDPVFRWAIAAQHHFSPRCRSSSSCRSPRAGPAAEPAGYAAVRSCGWSTFAPYVLSEATTAVIWLLMLQPGGFVDQFLTRVRPRRPGPPVAGRPAHRALHAVRGDHLEVHRLRDHPAPGRAAGHTRRAEGGGRHRRGVALAIDPPHRPAAARPRRSGSGFSWPSSARFSCSTSCGS